MAKGGLFAVMGPPSDDEDDFSDDAMPAEEDDMGADVELGGPFDAYAETIFDPKADTASKTEALRQAIMTLLEERGG